MLNPYVIGRSGKRFGRASFNATVRAHELILEDFPVTDQKDIAGVLRRPGQQWVSVPLNGVDNSMEAKLAEAQAEVVRLRAQLAEQQNGATPVPPTPVFTVDESTGGPVEPVVLQPGDTSTEPPAVTIDETANERPIGSPFPETTPDQPVETPQPAAPPAPDEIPATVDSASMTFKQLRKLATEKGINFKFKPSRATLLKSLGLPPS